MGWLINYPVLLFPKDATYKLFMFHNHKEMKPVYPLELSKMDTKASCTPVMQELLTLRRKTKKLVDEAYGESYRYHIRRMYFQAEVKGRLVQTEVTSQKTHPVGIPWLNEPDSYASRDFLDKSKKICEEQVIGNIPQHICKLREITRLSQHYLEIFRDLNQMVDWTERVSRQLENLKGTLADPWCLLTNPAPIQDKLEPLYTLEKVDKRPYPRKSIWNPEVVYEPWESPSLSKVWPNSRLKIHRNQKVQPDSCQPKVASIKRNSQVRSYNRKLAEHQPDNEVQSEGYESPSLPRRRFPKTYAQVLASMNNNQNGS